MPVYSIFGTIFNALLPIILQVFIIVVIWKGSTILIQVGKKLKNESDDRKMIFDLVHTLREENAVLKSELAIIKENVISTNKMLKEVE